jgi:Arc/MetJ-type ribon-helix-helix transcriptional regulator
MGYDSGMSNTQRKHIKRTGKQNGKAGNTQTSLRLPESLYERAKKAVDAGKTGSINELLVRALTAYLRALERKAIDQAFEPMAADTAYRKEALKIAAQFSASDAESLRLTERDLAEL